MDDSKKKINNKTILIKRIKGSGRPTKKERREINIKIRVQL